MIEIEHTTFRTVVQCSMKVDGCLPWFLIDVYAFFVIV